MEFRKRGNLKKRLKKELTDLIIFLAFFLGSDGLKTPAVQDILIQLAPLEVWPNREHA